MSRPYHVKLKIVPFLAAILWVAAAQPAVGQLKRTTISFNAGFNIANATVAIPPDFWNDAETKLHPGFSAGVALDLYLTKIFSLRIDGIYNRKSIEIEAQPIGLFATILPDVSIKQTLEYLEIPVVLDAGVELGAFRTHIFGGINAGILLNAQSEIIMSSVPTGTSSLKQESTTFLKDLVLYGELGAGVEYKFVRLWSLGIDIRYSHGLTSIATEEFPSIPTEVPGLPDQIQLPKLDKARDLKILAGLRLRL